MIRATRDTQCIRILLLAVGIMAALSLGLAARSTWSYSPTNGVSSNTLSLIGTFGVSSRGDARGLDVVIYNPTDSLLTILWDESAMVLPGNVSERIVHTGIRIIDKAAPQAPTALAPHSKTTETIWPALYVTTGNYSQCSSISLQNNCTISLYLTIQDASGKRVENWTWTFTETKAPEAPEAPRKPINWWFWIGIFFGLGLIGMILDPE